jgi:hypothetical protein
MAVATLVAGSMGVAGLAGSVEREVSPSMDHGVMATDTGRAGRTGPARDGSAWTSTAADRESVSITVYNQNFGLVREVRGIAFQRGTAPLEFADVAQHVQPETVHIRALDGGLRILEQNYQFDLLNPQKLLEKYVGRTVTVWRYDQALEREVPVEAEVLSVNGGAILRIGDEITFNYPGRFSFPEIPDNLIARPTLKWLLDSERENVRLETSYLTNNMNWKADYVMVIDETDRLGDITGWVTLTNQSGATYENARLKLVAGDVRRITGDPGRLMRDEAHRAVAAAEMAPQFSEESFFEYHLYTLSRPTTLLENEQKQVTLLESEGIALKKRLSFYGAAHYYRGSYGEVVSNQKVGVFIEFDNSQRNRLGMPLPNGIVRVYKADPSGAQQFVGEDRIDHTPRDERVRIRMGEAFDVVGDRRQMDYDVISSCVSESDWEVTLRNHKDEDVEVDVIEPVGGDWTILSTSHPYTRVDAHTFTYRVTVEANGETTIRYRVRVRWC